jgi:hypothetical protein
MSEQLKRDLEETEEILDSSEGDSIDFWEKNSESWLQVLLIII